MRWFFFLVVFHHYVLAFQGVKVKISPLPQEKRRKIRSLEDLPSRKNMRGNLSRELLRHSSKLTQGEVIYVKETIPRLGDVLSLKISFDLFTSSLFSQPVVAQVIGGKFQGSRLVGKATLNTSTKQVLIVFEKMKLFNSEKEISLKAQVFFKDKKFDMRKVQHRDSQEILNYLLERASYLLKEENKTLSESLLEAKNFQSYLKTVIKKGGYLVYLKAPLFVKAVVLKTHQTKGENK